MIRGLCYSWTKLWTTCCIQWARLVLFTGAITECSMEFTAPTSIFRLNFLNSSKKDLLVSYSSIIESMEKHICWYEGSSLLNHCILLDYFFLVILYNSIVRTANNGAIPGQKSSLSDKKTLFGKNGFIGSLAAEETIKIILFCEEWTAMTSL